MATSVLRETTLRRVAAMRVTDDSGALGPAPRRDHALRDAGHLPRRRRRA
jgi:hypothetical protein